MVANQLNSDIQAHKQRKAHRWTDYEEEIPMCQPPYASDTENDHYSTLCAASKLHIQQIKKKCRQVCKQSSTVADIFMLDLLEYTSRFYICQTASVKIFSEYLGLCERYLISTMQGKLEPV